MMEVIYDNGKQLEYISELTKSATWSGDSKQAARKLELSLSNVMYLENGLLVDIKKGREIIFRKDKQELFRGTVFVVSTDTDGQQNITCYDDNYYLTKNFDSYKFVNKKASEIVSRLCSDFGIPVGIIRDTGYVIPKLIFKNKSLWEMMVTALTLTRKVNGANFVINSQRGKLNLVKRQDQLTKIVIARGSNLLSGTVTSSIEDTRTTVKVSGGPKGKEVTVKVTDSAMEKQFGKMQHFEDAGEKTSAQVQSLAKKLLKDLAKEQTDIELDALGVPSITSLTSVHASDKVLGLSRGFYVTSDVHQFEGKSHKMSLTLSVDLELPELEDNETETERSPKKRKKKRGGSGVKDGGKQRVWTAEEIKRMGVYAPK